MADNKFDLGALLADVSKLDTGIKGRDQIEYIALDHIKPDPRNFYALTGIDELAASIEFVGLQQPIRIRRDDEHDGDYVIVSGHRRHAALTQLVDDGADKFRLAPCIVEQASGEPSEVESMLQELRLIYGNSDTRQLTSSDVAKQAERVETLLYQLKEAGVEFPGRMRDHVAEACKVSASKLARLKLIQSKLVPLNYREMWEDGRLPEQTAYAIARMEPMMQEEIAQTCPKTPPIGVAAERIQQMGMGYYLAREQECPSGDEGCTNGKRFLARDAHASYVWDVGGCGCCLTCNKATTCAYACPSGKEQAKKIKAEAEDKKKRRQAKEQAEVDKTKTYMAAFASRVNEAAGGDVDKFRAARIVLDKSPNPHERAFVWWGSLEDIAFRGKSPSGHNPYCVPNSIVLAGLCRELGCSMDYLMGLSEDVKGGQASADDQTVWRPGSEEPGAEQHVIYVDRDGYVDEVTYRPGLSLLPLQSGSGRVPWCEIVDKWTPYPDPEK